MKTKLSAWKYVKNNKHACAVLITALGMSFMAMYVLYALLQTTVESFKPIMLELPKKISYALITGSSYGLDVNGYETYEELEADYDECQERLMESLKERPEISDAFYTQILMSMYQSVVGQFAFETPLIEPDMIPGFLDHFDAELVEGRMPSGDGEMLVDETIMKNAGYSLGGYFMENWYGETFKIVGVISSKYLISVGTPMGYSNSGWYMVILGDESVSDLSAVLREEGIAVKDSDVIYDAVHYAETYRKDVYETIHSVVDTILLVIMIILTILVMVSYVSFMRNRVSEYCLYASIGFSRYEIYGMILREMMILFGLSCIAGFTVSIIVSALMKYLVVIPRGLTGYIFYGEQVFKIISIFLFIIGMLQIPVLICISRIRTIDAVEK